MEQVEMKSPTPLRSLAIVPSIVIALAVLSGPARAQDAANGAKVFKKCSSCHTVGTAAKNKVGPALNGVVGRAAGQAPGYKFSKAMLESGLTWDDSTLAAYLRDSNSLVKGTRMKFAGLKKDGDIADVIAYLKTFGPDGSPK